MDDLDFILTYKDMKSISDVCENLGINYSNLVNGRTSKENEKKVADVLKVECFKIFSVIKMMEEN